MRVIGTEAAVVLGEIPCGAEQGLSEYKTEYFRRVRNVSTRGGSPEVGQ